MTPFSPQFTRVTTPFLHFVADGALDETTLAALSSESEQVRALAERVHSKPGGDKTYAMNFVSLVVAGRETDAVTALPATWADLCRTLAHQRFRNVVTCQTGIDVTTDKVEIGVYVHREGDSVSVHRDKEHKTLSCILYLNREWREPDGGEFLLFDDGDLGNPVDRVRPAAGRCIAFAPAADSWHAVSPVAPGRLRHSVQIEFSPCGQSRG